MKTLWILCLLSCCAPLPSEAQKDRHIPLTVQRSATFPFSMYNGFMVVDVVLDGVLPLHFIFDTGAEQSMLLKPELIRILDLPVERRVRVLGADLSREMYGLTVRNIDIEFRNTLKLSTDLIVLEEPYLNLDEVTGVQIEGILGANILRKYVVEIDYQRLRITLHNPDRFEAPKPDFVRQKADFLRNKPYLEMQVLIGHGPAVPVKLLLDSGAAISMVLYTNTASNLSLPPNHIKGKLGSGLGGFLEGYVGRVQSLEMESFKFHRMITSFQDLDSARLQLVDPSRNGILGNLILRKFTVLLDYPRQQVYLRANKYFADVIEFDRSGLFIISAGAALDEKVVLDVIAGSPAAEAGIRRGDRLLRCKGWPVSLMSLDRVNSILSRPAGRKVRLRLEREGERFRRSLVLRDLI